VKNFLPLLRPAREAGRRNTTVSLAFAVGLACVMLVPAVAQQKPPAPAQPSNSSNPSDPSNPSNPSKPSAAPLAGQSGLPPSISLSPAVIMARGSYGQGLTQTLTLSNNTSAEFAFEMEAQDVVVQDGKRVYIAAGETQNSIAASAVFSQKQVIVKPYSMVSVDVRLTIPAETKLRAVVALFRGTNRLPTSSSAVGMTASLGALITFNLTDNVKLEPEAVRVIPATETSNLTISEWVKNVGTEPAVPDGLAVVLSAQGSLVSKMPFQPQRLLPGERLEFSAEYPDQLQPGEYKAMCTFQFEGKILTNDAAFKMQ